MQLDRSPRFLSATPLFVGLLLWALASCGGTGAGAVRPGGARPGGAAADAPAPIDIYLGTYTGQGKPGSRGIYRAVLDRRSGALGPPTLAAEIESPSFLAIAPSGRFLYAVSEISDPVRGGLVTAFAIEATGGLRRLNQQPSGGAAPCYVAVDPSGGRVVVANYGGGSVASFPVLADGSLGAAASIVKHVGAGPDAGRQREPHAHSILFDPKGQRAYAADLGADKVLVYRVGEQGALTANDPADVSLSPGSGPRHLAFGTGGHFLYANDELTSAVTVFAHDATTGALREVQTLATVPVGFIGKNTTAQIQVSSDGRFLYVSNRGHDSIALFAIERGGGTLTPIGHQPTRGKTPRNFAIDPSGAFLVVANQDSNDLFVFRRDGASGRLAPAGAGTSLPRPVCVAFARRGL